FTICHKTEVVKNTLNPVWQAFKISVRALCNGDYDRYGVFCTGIGSLEIVMTSLENSAQATENCQEASHSLTCMR
ncbi:hypothetical protein cypCar_00013375, partial [Cyprinus carpio]